MKRKILSVLNSLNLACLTASAASLGAAFTYQGQLQQSGQPVHGLYDFRFNLWDASNSPPGILIGETQTVSAVTVNGGLFTVALDFGPSVLNGDARWLEIALRTNGLAGDYTALTPRQPLTPTPYALRALAVWPGADSLVTGQGATISGGASNTNRGEYAFLGGGRENSIYASGSTIGGGWHNQVAMFADGSTIGGGWQNAIQADALTGTIAGGQYNTIWGDAYESTIGGGSGNAIAFHAGLCTIAGGGENQIQSDALQSTIGGGRGNTIGTNAESATIGGGSRNTNSGSFATIGGGQSNVIAATAANATVGGGSGNTSSGMAATVPGGSQNTARGSVSLAAGHRAQALHDGAFVWADSIEADVASTNANSWTVRASGGVTFFTASNLASGASLPAGSGSWSSLSDRAAKDDVRPVDGRAVLERLACVPLSTWRYKTQAPEVRHVGPMAQDFHAAFGVGEDDRHISSVDADGVGLAAIQGLNQKLEETLNERDAKIAALEKRLAAMEELLEANFTSGRE